MIEIFYEGWFQCRLATGPDEYLHPRGSSGWTFAFGSEPDLDRIIRFSDPAAPRSHAPQVGVKVNFVEVDNQPDAGHALLGATVSLAEEAKFEGHDGDIASDAREPIAPYRLVIEQGDLRLEAFDPFDITSPAEIGRRTPFLFESSSAEVLAVTGITDRQVYRQNKVNQIEAEIGATTDAGQLEVLQSRLEEARLSGIRRTSLGFKLSYDFVLRGPHQMSEEARTALEGRIHEQSEWRSRFWMGGWDADALCAYVKGSLLIV